MLKTLNNMHGYRLRAQDGDLGKVKDFYFDDLVWTIRYLVADTGAWLTHRQVLISPGSLGQPTPSDRTLGVNLTRQQIENSPPVDADKPVSRRKEEELIRYYAWQPYWTMLDHEPFLSPGMAAARAETAVTTKGDVHLTSAADVRGYAIHAEDGDVGTIQDFIVDTELWAIRYAIIKTSGWLHGRLAIIESEWIRGVDWESRGALVKLSRDQVRRSPAYDPARPIEAQLATLGF